MLSAYCAAAPAQPRSGFPCPGRKSQAPSRNRSPAGILPLSVSRIFPGPAVDILPGQRMAFTEGQVRRAPLSGGT